MINKPQLETYLCRIDSALQSTAQLYIYGSAALMLLGEETRVSLDIDVAGPYSVVSRPDLEAACKVAGLPINPEPDFPGEHLKWVDPLRLCLPPPPPFNTDVIVTDNLQNLKTDMQLWRLRS